MTEIAVAIRSVRKTFAESVKPALDGVSLEILKNEFFTLLGPSGCGKTTLLRMIAGFETPDSGVIELEGVDTGTTPPNKRPVNTVFQSYALFPHMSVEQNIAFALDMLGQKKDITRIRVAEMVRLVKLEGLEQRRPGQLSGGQQQRVALARALAPSPKVLLLDEPLSALDLKLRKEMQVELKRLQTATGITFVFVTHDQEEALTMSDRVAVMQSGEVMQVGSPTDIYEHPSNLDVAAFIGDANFLKATCVARSGEGGTFRLALDSSSDVLIEASDANCSQIGTKAILMVRPERIKLSQPGQASLIGTVRDTIYCGSDLMLHATIAEGTVLRARLDGVVDASNLRGTSTGFLIQAQAVRVFPT